MDKIKKVFKRLLTFLGLSVIMGVAIGCISYYFQNHYEADTAPVEYVKEIKEALTTISPLLSLQGDFEALKVRQELARVDKVAEIAELQAKMDILNQELEEITALGDFR